MTARPSLDRYAKLYRRYARWAEAIIIAAILLGLSFSAFFILPEVRVRRKRNTDLTTARRQIVERENEPSEEDLREDLEIFRAKRDEAARIFFSPGEVTELLNKLYQYASVSEVAIINLESEPTPVEEPSEVYDVQSFRVKAVGSVSDLIDFVTSIREASFPSFIAHDLAIVEEREHHALTMTVNLYTSSYSSGATVRPTPTPASEDASEVLDEMSRALDSAWAAGDWKEAIDLIFQLADVAPEARDWRETLYQAYVNYGRQLLEQGATSEARVQFELALGIKPEGEEARVALERIGAAPTPTLSPLEQLMRQLDEAWAAQNWREAIDLLERVRAIDSNYDDAAEKLYAARVNYGYTLMAQGKLAESKIAFSDALAVNPNGEEAIAGLETLARRTPTPP
jgi:tetratricopeptide (TPR) repeat protein